MDFIDESAARSIRETIEAHRPFWDCLGAGDDALKN